MITRLLLSFFFICTVHSFAQNFSFSPGKTININGSADSVVVYGTTYLQCASPTAVSLRWKVISKSMPGIWQPFFCDNVICYPTLPDSANLAQVDSTQTATVNQMTLYVRPMLTGGIGQVKVEVFEISNPSNKDTLTYNINLTNATVGVEEESAEIAEIALRLYPNPTDGSVITIVTDSNEPTLLVVRDMFGKEIFAKQYTSPTLNLHEDVRLSAGVYNITLQGTSYSTTQQLIVK